MTYTVTNTFSSGVNTSLSSELNTNFDQAATQISDTSSGHTHNGVDSKAIGALVTETGTYNTETTTTSTSYQTVRTFTLTPDSSSNVLIGAIITFDGKSSDASTQYLNILLQDGSSTTLSSTTSEPASSSYQTFTFHLFIDGTANDDWGDEASYKALVQQRTGTGAYTVYVRNLSVKFIYADNLQTTSGNVSDA